MSPSDILLPAVNGALRTERQLLSLLQAEQKWMHVFGKKKTTENPPPSPSHTHTHTHSSRDREENIKTTLQTWFPGFKWLPNQLLLCPHISVLLTYLRASFSESMHINVIREARSTPAVSTVVLRGSTPLQAQKTRLKKDATLRNCNSLLRLKTDQEIQYRLPESYVKG
jgi:hypothetical protein